MRLAILLLTLLATAPLSAAPPANDSARADARRVAARIDAIIAAAQSRAGVKPAPLADDAAFLRRASLDIAGKIPSVHDARSFLQASSPDRRADAIDRLLDSPGYVNHFTSLWLELLVPEAAADFQKRFLLTSMQPWLRKQFSDNTPYDEFARRLVALPLSASADPRAGRPRPTPVPTDLTPISFYQAKQGKPEELAAAVARLFLGVRLECAQCHDHPFGKWKREEFWSQAAFFGGLSLPNGNPFVPPTEVSDRRELPIPNTDRVAQARFLDGKQPRWRFKTGARVTYADWITARDNPFFARAIVNRMWAHFFGIGLVEPVDDLVDDNPPSHPEILDLLAREFVSHDFDLKFLIRAITLTRTYQLASAAPDSPGDPRLFARMQVKGLTGEQLYLSLCEAAGIRDASSFQQRLYNFGTPRQQFLDRFADQEKKTEYHTSIPQALTMMNNQLINDATHPDRGEVLGAIVAAPFLDTAGKIEALYLAALSRKPRPDEVARLLRYVDKGGAGGNSKKALSDVFWALLNSTEFRFNH